MFWDCSSLNYLDLSNFDTKSIENMAYMFYNCSSLIYLNLFNFKITRTYDRIFEKITSDVKYCINDTSTQNYLLGKDKKSNCEDKCFQRNTMIDKINRVCVEYYNTDYNIIINDERKNFTIIEPYLFKNQEDLISEIRTALINKYYLDDIDKGEDYFIKKNNFIYTLSSTKNQRKNKNNNNITIDLDKCENRIWSILSIFIK